MISQPLLMGCIGAICVVSAGDWFYRGNLSDAICFFAFGIGYFALARAIAHGGI